jgi:hypothetical protein
MGEMLSKNKITIEAKTVVDGKEISGHRAIMTEEKISFLPWQIDKEACKEHRKVIREDAAVFEDCAYELQEHVFPKGDK